MPDSRPTPTGFDVRRSGQFLERVVSQLGEFRLLSTHGGNEVVEGRLERGGRLTLLPPSETGAVYNVTYYLLEGSLVSLDELEGEPLGPGDHIVVRELRNVQVFEAVTDVRFLCVAPRPMFHELRERIAQLQHLSVEVELKDGYTADHCVRLQRLSIETGKVLGVSGRESHMLEYASYLHDLGKVKVPLVILNKPSTLTAREWDVMRQHPTFGREMLEGTALHSTGTIVEQHHERLDGSGYPFGLAGDEIRIEAYIVAVADTFDAMTTDRPYRGALSPIAAFAELEKYSDVHYPRDVVHAFREVARNPGHPRA